MAEDNEPQSSEDVSSPNVPPVATGQSGSGSAHWVCRRELIRAFVEESGSKPMRLIGRGVHDDESY